MIERGANVDDFDDDNEKQSEDESNLSGVSNDKAKPNKTATNGKLGELVTSGKTMTQDKANAMALI